MGTRHKGTKGEVRALNTFIKLMRCADSVLARNARRIAEAGLTVSQFGALEALFHLGPLPQGEIAAKMLKSESNITFVLDKLEQRGLVKRTRDTGDRRVVNVHLTPAGRKFIAGIFPRIAAAIEDEMKTLTAAEQDGLGLLCRKLGLQESGSRKAKR